MNKLLLITPILLISGSLYASEINDDVIQSKLINGGLANDVKSVTSKEIDPEKLDIRAITPIRNGMTSEPQQKAIEEFLADSLKPEFEINNTELSKEKMKIRKVGASGEFYIYTLENNSEWVCGKGGLERFLGYLYLKKAIEFYGLKKFRVVGTRFAYRTQNRDINHISITETIKGIPVMEGIPVIDSMNFYSFSHYVGDEYLTYEDVYLDKEILGEFNTLRDKIGFKDVGCGSYYANLRKKDGMIYIIDTEYNSFSSPTEGNYFSGYTEEDKKYLEKVFSSF